VFAAVVVTLLVQHGTSCSGFFTGSWRSMSWSIKVKIAVLAPVPRAKRQHGHAGEQAGFAPMCAGRSGNRTQYRS
jgi:hypothetical protein